MNVLFICNQNRYRSRTAEEIFREKFTTSSAGLFAGSPVTKKKLAEADLVVVMEDFQRAELARRFPEQYLKKRIVCLDIPDRFFYKQPELVELLNSRLSELV